MNNSQRLAKKELKNARHKLEIFMYFVCIIVGLLIITGSFTTFLSLIGFSYIEVISLIVVSPIVIFISFYFWYGSVKAYSIRVSEKNFPEIYLKSLEYADKLGLKKVPAVYIEQHNGVLNAFAAAVFGKRYAGLHAELVDIAYMENKDFNPIYFVLAHEFAHIYYKHVTFWHNLMVFPSRLIPIIGSAHSRAREYSCDRVAQLLTDSDGIYEMMVFTVGRHLYKYIDVDDYLKTTKMERGIWTRIINMLVSHPITQKRIAALIDPEKKSGSLF
ncbi:MAG: M48 family metallopeptidase [Defluviitaleaceae bacterium]|nr:M48 family metallopeptidase [Defluviitaleaceae bacterium]